MNIAIEKQKAILVLYDANPAISIKELAQEVGCSQQTANTYLRRSGRETSKRRQRKNRRYISSDGYVTIYAPEHFAARKGGIIREHILKACNALGRKLKKNEVVHHINGNKQDNRNCNLLVCNKSYHSWLHHEMSRRYQQEHFA